MSKLKTNDDKTPVDVRQRITDSIVRAIEAGAGEFTMPWHRPGASFDLPKNVETGSAYRGINVLALWVAADERKYEHHTWGTFNQWRQLGAMVNKGEKGSLVVKYGTYEREVESPKDGEAGTETGKYLKHFWVFNAAQVTGYDIAPEAPREDLTTRLRHVDTFVANTSAVIHSGGQRAFYRHLSADGSGDFIMMPDRALFTGTDTSTPTEAFEATRLHELGHWSGSRTRLNREFGKRFGDAAYAFEEITVEIMAAYACAHLQITNTPRADHAQYIENWLKVLKCDKSAIFKAAAEASKALDYLIGLQPGSPVVDPDSAAPEPAAPAAGRAIPTRRAKPSVA
jgi:antirestriction protein ArdC